ncbi:MAG: NfeD family protein [Bacteroidota bacterium]
MGLVLLVIEILVIPGSTIVGVLGFGAMVYAIYNAYVSHGATGGMIAVGVTLTLTVITILYTMRSKTWKKFALNDELPHRMNDMEGKNINIGDEGITMGRCAPSGNATFNDEVYEVHTFGDFIDPNTPVVVTKIEGYKIFVKRKLPANGI